MNRLPTIDSPRTRLRPLCSADAPALFAVFSDPGVLRYWSTPAMKSLAEALELIADVEKSVAERTLFQWGLVRRDDDRVIGTATLARLDFQHRRAEIGYALSSEHWGGGLMTATLIALIDHAFGELDLHRLEADVDPRNERSIRLLEKLGFEREGLLRERWIVNGEVQDSAIYGLVRGTWKRDRS